MKQRHLLALTPGIVSRTACTTALSLCRVGNRPALCKYQCELVIYAAKRLFIAWGKRPTVPPTHTTTLCSRQPKGGQLQHMRMHIGQHNTRSCMQAATRSLTSHPHGQASGPAQKAEPKPAGHFRHTTLLFTAARQARTKHVQSNVYSCVTTGRCGQSQMRTDTEPEECPGWRPVMHSTSLCHFQGTL